MHARVTRLRILPGKIEQFTKAVDSMVPAARKQQGFRALLVLRTGDESHPEATTVSVWESLDDLRASESNMFYFEALARLFSCCEGYPIMHEEEVLLSEFASP